MTQTNTTTPEDALRALRGARQDLKQRRLNAEVAVRDGHAGAAEGIVRQLRQDEVRLDRQIAKAEAAVREHNKGSLQAAMAALDAELDGAAGRLVRLGGQFYEALLEVEALHDRADHLMRTFNQARTPEDAPLSHRHTRPTFHVEGIRDRLRAARADFDAATKGQQ